MSWIKCRFNEFIQLQRGFDLPKSKMKDGDIPVVGSNSIIGYHNEAKVEGPGVITGRSGTIGEVQYIDDLYWPHNTSLWVKDFKGNHQKFVYYKLQTLNLKQFNGGASVPTLNRNVLDGIPVVVPPLPTQKRIADILSAYDDLIENNNRRIALLEQAARHLYKEWFVRFKFPGHEKVKVVDGVPEGWERKTLGDFYKTSSGGTPSRKIPDFYTGNINWVKTQELQGGFIFETTEKITEEAIKKSSAKLFQQNSVIVAMYGATIGQVSILGEASSTNQACCALLPNNNDYIYAYLFLLENKSGLINLSQGAAQKNISQEIIKNYTMIYPAKRVLSYFCEWLEPSFEEYRLLQLQLKSLKKARDLLLPRLMNKEFTI